MSLRFHHDLLRRSCAWLAAGRSTSCTLGSPRYSQAFIRFNSVSPGVPKSDTAAPSEWPHPIFASSRISDRKSVFLAHASTLPNATCFPSFLAYLKSQSALRRATHCMYAYRTSDPLTSRLVLGQNDGGESGSGDRLARLLELAGCENAVVVVSRWYGGVQLGSDRWRLISSVANAALDSGGLKRSKLSPIDPHGKPKKKRK